MTADARPADRPGPRVDPEATLIVTRPEPEATRLVDGLIARGRRAFAFPALAIAPPTDTTALERRMAAIDQDALVIFVSPNAIRHAIGARRAPWPPKTPIGVMGPGSVEALAALGVAARIVAPREAPDRSDNERFDSEALFDALDDELGLTRGFDGRVLIVRGNGGRGWLAERLRGEGVTVDEVEAYRRGRGAPDAEAVRTLRRLFVARAPAAFVITSSEAVDHVVGLVEATLADAADAVADVVDARAWLFATPVIAPHRRIVERAEATGFRRVVGVGPGDRGLYAAIE